MGNCSTTNNFECKSKKKKNNFKTESNLSKKNIFKNNHLLFDVLNKESILNEYNVFNLKREDKPGGNHMNYFYGNERIGFDVKMKNICKNYYHAKYPNINKFIENLIEHTIDKNKYFSVINEINYSNNILKIFNIIKTWDFLENNNQLNLWEKKIILILEKDLFLIDDGIDHDNINTCLNILINLSTRYPSNLIIFSEPNYLKMISFKEYYINLNKYCVPYTLYLKPNDDINNIIKDYLINYNLSDYQNHRLIIKSISQSGDRGVIFKLSNSNINKAIKNKNWKYNEGNELKIGIKSDTILSKIKDIFNNENNAVIIQPMLDIDSLLEYKILIVDGEPTDIIMSVKPPGLVLTDAPGGHYIWSLTAYIVNPKRYLKYLSKQYGNKLAQKIKIYSEKAQIYIDQILNKTHEIIDDLQKNMMELYPQFYSPALFLRIDLFLTNSGQIFLNEIEPWACGKFWGAHSISGLNNQNINILNKKNIDNVKKNHEIFTRLSQFSYEHFVNDFIKNIEKRCNYYKSDDNINLIDIPNINSSIIRMV